MLPIRDHNPSERTPYVTYALIAANVLVFAVILLPLQGNELALFRVYHEWGIVPAREPGEAHTYLTSMFLHGGFMHIAGNMLFLWIYGDNLEDEMGHLPFLVFYMAAGIAAGAIHVISAPSSPVPTVGASGAIAGVMGGYLLMYPKAKIDILFIFIVFFKIIPIPAWVVLSLWMVLQFVGGFSTIGSEEGGVAYWAHIGGFVAGILLTLPLWLRRGGAGYWSQTEGHPPHPETEYRRTTIPVVPRR